MIKHNERTCRKCKGILNLRGTDPIYAEKSYAHRRSYYCGNCIYLVISQKLLKHHPTPYTDRAKSWAWKIATEIVNKDYEIVNRGGSPK